MSEKPNSGRWIQLVPWELAVYIDTFDTLFTFLAQVEHYINVGLLQEQDVVRLAYWLTLIEKLPSPDDDQPIFPPYLKKFHYHGVLDLAARLRHLQHELPESRCEPPE